MTSSILHARDGIATGHLDGVCAVLWRALPTPARFDAQNEAVSYAARHHLRGTALLLVFEAASKPPSPELRVRYSAMLDEHAARIRALACVIEATGFAAAHARSVLSGIELALQRRAFATSYFSSVPEAGKWIANDDARAEQIVELTAQLRAALDEDSLGGAPNVKG